MEKPEKRILLSGASGLIGSALRRSAASEAVELIALVRGSRLAGAGEIAWDPREASAVLPRVEMEGFDAVVHLSGANVGRRWTQAYRQEIVSSRVASTGALCTALTALSRPPRVLLCASAVGIYGDCGDAALTEQSPAGSGFLAKTCVAWEAATATARAAGIRVVHLRFGVVLSRDGGALGKMLPAFRAGLGGRLGSGRQWMSWISLWDAVRAVWFLMEHEGMAGAFNLTAPHPVTNATLTRELAEAVHRPAWLPVPAAALRLMFGSMAHETLLASQRALPQRLQEAGFGFEDAEIGTTLRALLG